MKYKGYEARIEYSAEDNLLVGRVINARDSISFHGKTVAEVRAAFETMIDDYLIMCANEGIEPNKPKGIANALSDSNTNQEPLTNGYYLYK